MKRKQLLTYLVIAAALAVLAYLQVRAWRKFDWDILITQLKGVNWFMVGGAVALIYCDYFLRALRWKLLLAPVKKTSALALTPSQFIGFTALAILGRPGDFIRPYIIAKRENLSVPSQLAVWTVERIFDSGAFALILVSSMVIFRSELAGLPYFKTFEHKGIPVAVGFVFFLAGFALVLRFWGKQLAGQIEKRFSRFTPKLTSVISHKITGFSDGLNTIQNISGFLQIFFLSLVIWSVIAVCYWLVVYSYPDPKLHMPLSFVLLLMGFSVIGGVAQLPMVGGGSQLLTIAALEKVFGLGHEPAVGCGMLLWIVTFMSVIPAGLALARREHISITHVTAEEDAEPAEARP